LVRADPSDIGLQRDLSVSFNKIGEVLVAVGDLPGALKCCHDSVAITERLARSDPGNAGWQRDLAVSYERLGNVQKAQGDLAGALKSYRNTLAVTGRLALSDSGNAGWQRDLVVSFNRVGDVQLAQGDVAGAMKSYQDSLVIGEQLARSDPGNPGLREMAAAYSKLANMFAKSGDRTKALDAARRGQAVMSRLAALSPANDAWKRDLGWFNGVIAQLSQS
jgi:tetratricopeptide (TPR) repeat protein